jgi:hypothetical protein
VRAIKFINKGFAIVDDEDHAMVSRHKWYGKKNAALTTYANANTYIDKKPGIISMHRLIMGEPEGKEIDHINGHGWDNRRSNLRVCTTTENHQNSRPYRNGTSKYKGVSWSMKEGKWICSVNHKTIGLYECELDAAVMYDELARKEFGEFARTNFQAITI